MTTDTIGYAASNVADHADDAERKAALQALGLSGTQDSVKEAYSRLGRSAQLPWSLPEFLALHPYLDAGCLMLVPPAHNLLRGPVRETFSFALTTTAAEMRALGLDPVDHPFVFSAAQRRDVQVCTQPLGPTPGCHHSACFLLRHYLGAATL